MCDRYNLSTAASAGSGTPINMRVNGGAGGNRVRMMCSCVAALVRVAAFA